MYNNSVYEKMTDFAKQYGVQFIKRVRYATVDDDGIICSVCIDYDVAKMHNGGGDVWLAFALDNCVELICKIRGVKV